MGLFDLVMEPAGGPAITFTGPAPLVVRDRVFEIALDRGPTADGEAARDVADLDQVPERR